MTDFFKNLNEHIKKQKLIDAKDLIEAREYHSILSNLSNYCTYGRSSINEILTAESISFLKDREYFSIDANAKLKKDSHHETSLFATYKFDSYYNLSEYDMPLHPIRVDIIRQEKSLDNFPELKKDLNSAGFNATKIIDIEFFEQMHDSKYPDFWDRVTKQYNDSAISHKNLKEKFESEGIHIEKEKIHLQYAVDKENNFIPVYIGIGTNQPYGLSIEGSEGKNRFYRLDLMNASIEQNVCFTEKNISDYTINDGAGCFDIVESFQEDHTRSVGLFYLLNNTTDDLPVNINSPKIKPKKFINDLIKYELKFHTPKSYTSKKSPAPVLYRNKPLAKVTCDFPITNLNRVNKLKDLQTYWSNSDLLSLIDVNKRTILKNKTIPTYEEYFSTFYHPARLIQEFGATAIINHLIDNARGIRAKQDFEGMINSALRGNLEFIIEDLELMGSTSPRLKVASLLLGIMIETKKLDKIIIDASESPEL